MTPNQHLAVIRRAAAKAASARQAYEQAMRSAADAGVPLRRIGEAAGLSHGRVSQILNGK